MKGLKSKDLLFVNNNNNQVQHYQKLYGSLNQKQQRRYSLDNGKIISVPKTNIEKQMASTTENACDTKIRQLNEYSYIISVDNSQQETEFHSGKSTLADIHTDLVRDTEHLSTSQGFIHIKEYALDGYQCRCHEHKDLLHDAEIDNEKYSFDYKLKF